MTIYDDSVYDVNRAKMTKLGKNKLLNICKNIIRSCGIEIKTYIFTIEYNSQDQITKCKMFNNTELYSEVSIDYVCGIICRQEMKYRDNYKDLKKYDALVLCDVLNSYNKIK